jgi:hypothetical protein
VSAPRLTPAVTLGAPTSIRRPTTTFLLGEGPTRRSAVWIDQASVHLKEWWSAPGPWVFQSVRAGMPAVYRSGADVEEEQVSESQPSSGNAPSAEELKERVDQTGEQINLGAGNEEPDPATAESPPSEIRAGDEERTQT